MKIEVKNKSDLILYAEDSNKPGKHVFLYRLRPLKENTLEVSEETFYIAVPNGKNIALKNLPEGSYELKKLKQE